MWKSLDEQIKTFALNLFFHGPQGYIFLSKDINDPLVRTTNG